LLNVNKSGWTETSIKTAANELNYSNSLSALLPNGPLDLIYHTMDKWNDKLSKDLEDLYRENNQNNYNIQNSTPDEKILKAIKLRLSYQTPLLNTWAQAMRLGMSPQNIKSTLDRLIKMTDIICSFDEKEDIEYKNYSIMKRYLVLKIFIFSELHLLTDRSYNYKNTYDFVEQLYWINFNFYSSFNRFTMVNSAFLTMIKYSLTAFAPYDFTKVDEILRAKQSESGLIN
jgi:rpsU-divergently transcribed protein